jgi:hypothetical protein
LLDKSNLGDPEVSVGKYGAYVTYTRVCNGLEFSQNSVQFSIDNDGNVTRYNKNWDKVEFEPVNNIVTDKNAFDEFDKWKNYSLKYVYNYKTKSYKLVYDFTQNENFTMVNAITGKAVSYSGVEYTKKGDGTYTDISDHWCKEIVETLALMGIKLDGDKFRPDEPITKSDFAKLLNSYYSYSGDDGDDYLTRYQAAEYVCGDVLGFKILKDKDELFVQPFEDVDEEHYAEVAFLKGLGMVNEAKKFNGDKLLTRAEAASMVYNAIKNNSLN